MRITMLLASLVLLLPNAAQVPAATAAGQETELTLTRERRELADIRIRLGAEREYAAARERLAALDSELADATGSDAEALRAEVRALLEEVRRALGESTQSSRDAQDRVDASVRKAIEEGDYGFVQEIGPRAAPALREAVRAQPDVLPSEVGADPFYYLCYVAPAEASALCEELAGEQGYFWKRRVLRALKTVGFGDKRLWAAEDQGRFLAPGYLRVLEGMAAEPDLAASVVELLPELVKRGALTPALEAALVGAMQSPDPKLRQAGWEAGSSPRLESVYVELLAHEDAGVRLRAAEEIVRTSHESRALLEKASDPDPRMRGWVAIQLSHLPLESWTPAERELLVLFLQDEDPDVLRTAMELAMRLPKTTREPSPSTMDRSLALGLARQYIDPPLPDEVFRRLAARHDPETRKWLTQIVGVLPAPLAFDLARDLASDPDPEIVRRLLRGDLQVLWWEDVAAALEVVGAALSNPAVSRSQALEPTSIVLRNIGSTHARELWRWTLDRSDLAVLEQMLEMHFLGSQSLEELPAELVPELCAQVYALDPDRLARLVPSARQKQTLTPEQTRSLDQLARDAARPAGLRLLAARSAPPRAGDEPAWLANTRAFLADPFWHTADPSFWGDRLAELVQPLVGETRNALVSILIGTPGLPAALIADAVRQFSPGAPGDAEVVRALLESGYESEDQGRRELASFALRSMGRSAALADRAWLERAARGSDGNHQYAALNAMGELADPAYLPLLEELLRNDAASPTQIAKALSGYLSSEAGELLLVAATKLSGEALDLCLAHIEKIRAYQEARERWATRRVQGQVRADVLAELLRQLEADSDEIRVQAIRALATWEAVEAMPRLIELTSARSPSVAQAAREALDRLNTPRD